MLYKRYFVVGLMTAAILATILLTVIAGLGLSVAASFSKKEETVQPEPIPRLEASLRGELNSALAPEFAFSFDQSVNPFADKTGVSQLAGGNKTPSANQVFNLPLPNATVVSKVSPVIPPSRIPGANFSPGVPPSIQPMPDLGVPINGQFPSRSAEVDTDQLLRERQRQIKLGKTDVPTVHSLFSIDNIKPYGIVGSGTNNRVKFYATDGGGGTRFAVGRNARFRDGTLESVEDEGVRFRRDNGETVLIRWEKNKSRDRANGADAPILRVDGKSDPQQ